VNFSAVLSIIVTFSSFTVAVYFGGLFFLQRKNRRNLFIGVLFFLLGIIWLGSLQRFFAGMTQIHPTFWIYASQVSYIIIVPIISIVTGFFISADLNKALILPLSALSAALIALLFSTNLIIDTSQLFLWSTAPYHAYGILHIICDMQFIAIVIWECINVTRVIIRQPHRRRYIVPYHLGFLFISISVIFESSILSSTVPHFYTQFPISILMLPAIISMVYSVLRRYTDTFNLLEKSEQKVKRLLFESKQNLKDFIDLIVTTIEAKDTYTHGHSQRVSHYATILANDFHFSRTDLSQLQLACRLHDIGKIGIPEAILNKPGRLTSQEYEIIKQHPVIAVDILGNVHDFIRILPIIAHHHEYLDGSGYPHGLKAEEISLEIRIISICDIFDALTTKRSYRDALAWSEAFQIIRSMSGTKLDATIVERFIAIIKKQYPQQFTQTLSVDPHSNNAS